MSYILEALAESEQARQRAVATPKYSLLPVLGEEPRQARRWPYALAGALLVSTLVLQGWLRPLTPGDVVVIAAPAVQPLVEPQLAPEPAIAPSVPMEGPKVGAGETAQIPEAAMPPPPPPPKVTAQRTTAPPPVLQQELPALSVAGFIHDEASGSMAIVNDKLVREGDEVSPGLILEKASADGLIFNYNGRRFKR